MYAQAAAVVVTGTTAAVQIYRLPSRMLDTSINLCYYSHNIQHSIGNIRINCSCLEQIYLQFAYIYIYIYIYQHLVLVDKHINRKRMCLKYEHPELWS
jgi:hypothetical protein